MEERKVERKVMKEREDNLRTLKQCPGHSTRHSREAGIEDSHRSTGSRCESRATTDGQEAPYEHGSTDINQDHAVRLWVSTFERTHDEAVG